MTITNNSAVIAAAARLRRPQRALQLQQQRPGRDNDHRRPYQGGQERPQDRQRAADQQQDQEHAEDDSHQIAGARRQTHRKPSTGRQLGGREPDAGSCWSAGTQCDAAIASASWLKS
jgi:hypothetical protein